MTIFQRIYMSMTMLQVRREDSDKGASMIEYAILVTAMAGVVGLAVIALGGKITTFINGITF